MILFCFFLNGCLEILVLAMPESLEAIAVKKSPKMPLWNFWTFFSFFQMAVDRVKMIFQTNKGLKCFKHYKFLIFDEKQLPQNFCSTYLQISTPSTLFLKAVWSPMAMFVPDLVCTDLLRSDKSDLFWVSMNP